MLRYVNFGFRKVIDREKNSLVADVFSSVAGKYDLMNDCMSFGIHRLWKRKAVNMLRCNEASKIIDVAGGTGDITALIAKQYNPHHIVLCDINHDMLNAGFKRHLNRYHHGGIERICGDAENLPVRSNSFDCYTISFGIRNVTDVAAALKEAYRVLVGGGQFLCLEFAAMQNKALSCVYNFYSDKVIPQMGAMIAGDSASYRYLIESIKVFPKQLEFSALLKEVGFKNVQYIDLSGGIATVYIGFK